MKNLKSNLSLRGKACFDVVISYKKSAAMFGLDARIALAIFGALSVISGAALFSAIQAAQTERYWQEFQEIIKASEAYYLDNGEMLEQYGSGNLHLHMQDLIENRENLRSWRGPYIAGDKYSTYFIRNSLTRSFGNNDYLYIYLFESSEWTSIYDVCIIDSIDCSEWISFRISSTEGIKKAKNLFTQLDKKIDNNDGVKSGNVRKYEELGDPPGVWLFIKGIPHKRIS